VDGYSPDQAADRRQRFINIDFQNGPIGEVGVNGCQVEDVIDAAIHRLQELNAPPHNNRETSLAITALEQAKLWLIKRTMDREARGVEGTSAS